MSLQPSLRAIRGAADNAAAAADATKLADTFDKVAAFWKARSADDAVKLAETARDAAKAIASGSGDKAANLMTIQGTCGPAIPLTVRARRQISRSNSLSAGESRSEAKTSIDGA